MRRTAQMFLLVCLSVAAPLKGQTIAFNQGDEYLSTSLPAGLADFNSDGYLDIVTNRVELWLGKGDGTFRAPQLLRNPNIAGIGRVLVGDLSGDARPDLFLAVAESSELAHVTCLLSLGDTNFEMVTGGPRLNGLWPSLVADFNTDGRADLVVFGQRGVQVQLSSGGCIFQPIAAPTMGWFETLSVELARVDPNASWDLVTNTRDISGGNAHTLPSTVYVMLGLGNGWFKSGPLVRLPLLSTAVAVHDFNGDGFADLLVSSPLAGRNNELRFWFQQSEKTFVAAPLTFTGGYGGSAFVFDANLDGKVDVVFGGAEGFGLAVIQSAGSASQVLHPPKNIRHQHVVRLVGDVNNDGKPDLVAAGARGFSVLLNSSETPPRRRRAAFR